MHVENLLAPHKKVPLDENDNHFTTVTLELFMDISVLRGTKGPDSVSKDRRQRCTIYPIICWIVIFFKGFS